MKSVLRDTTQNTCSCNITLSVNNHIVPAAWTAGARNHFRQILYNLQNTTNFIHSPGKPENHQVQASIRKTKNIFWICFYSGGLYWSVTKQKMKSSLTLSHVSSSAARSHSKAFQFISSVKSTTIPWTDWFKNATSTGVRKAFVLGYVTLVVCWCTAARSSFVNQITFKYLHFTFIAKQISYNSIHFFFFYY